MRCRCLLFVLLLALLVGPPAFAESKFEISPFLGYRLGGELDDLDFRDSFDFEDSKSQGLILDFHVKHGFYVELYYSAQETTLENDLGLFSGEEDLFDLDVDYYQIGGLYQWEIGQVIPFMVGTIGISEFDPAPANLDSETRFALTLGGGVKLMFSRHLGLRFDARMLATAIDDNSDSFCSRRCYGYDDGESLAQFEGGVGLVLSF